MFDKTKLPDLAQRLKALDLYLALAAAEDAMELEGDDASDEDYKKLDDAVGVATRAYEEFEAPALDDSYTDGVRMCAACGAPLFENDEVVEDYATGEKWLRVSLGLPPRPPEDEIIPQILEATA